MKIDPRVTTTTTIRKDDILMGRGGAANRNCGNLMYRRLVAKYRMAYQQAHINEKSIIRDTVIAEVKASSGRFVEAITQEDESIVYRPVTCRTIIKKKVTQALRDARNGISSPSIKVQSSTTKKSHRTKTKIPRAKTKMPPRKVRGKKVDLRKTAPTVMQVTQQTRLLRGSCSSILAAKEIDVDHQELGDASSSIKKTIMRRNSRLPIKTFPIHTKTIRNTEPLHDDVLDLLSIPLVPTPFQMFNTPPMITEAVCASLFIEQGKTVTYNPSSDIALAEIVPPIPSMTPSETRGTPVTHIVASYRLDNCETENKPWYPIMPTVDVASDRNSDLPTWPHRVGDSIFEDRAIEDAAPVPTCDSLHDQIRAWKNITNPQDSLYNMEPPSPRDSPNPYLRFERSPRSMLFEKEQWTVAYDRCFEETTARSPHFHLIRPTQNSVSSYSPPGSPVRAVLHLGESNHATEILVTQPFVRSRKEAIPESIKKNFLPQGSRDSKFSRSGWGMEQLSIREESPDPMIMFASAFRPSDRKAGRPVHSSPAKVTTSLSNSVSFSVSAPNQRALNQGGGISSQFVTSSPFSSQSILPHHATVYGNDHDFVDGTLQKETTSTTLEFAKTCRPAGFPSSKQLKLNSKCNEAAGVASLRTHSFKKLKLETTIMSNSGHRGHRIRRVSDINKPYCPQGEAESDEDRNDNDILSSSTRRVSL